MNVPSQFNLIPQFTNRLWIKFQQAYQQLAIVINGNISFGQLLAKNTGFIIGASTTAQRVGGQNIDGTWAVFLTPGTPNTDFTVTHNLGRPITGYLVMSKSAACDLYSSPTNAAPYSNTTFIFRATTTASLLVFFF